MNVEKELWLFKVAQVLIERYGYTLIDVRAIQEEIWLNHPDKPEFGLIRLSLYKGFDLKNIKERTLKIKHAIVQILPNVAKFWDVEIDEEGFLQEDELERIHLVISPQDAENALLNVFPDIKLAFSESDDPEKELEDLKKRIQSVHTPKKPTTWNEQFKRLPKMTVSVLGICILLTLIINGMSLLGYDIITVSILFGAYYKTFILANYEVWRFFTAGFVHIDIFHLAMNGIALMNLGSFVERLYGPKRLLLILLNGIFFGTFFVFVGQGNILLVGISGGLYALLGVMLIYLFETGLIRQPMIQSQVLRMVFMNVLINFLPNISVLGHLGGLISGVMIGLVFTHKPSWLSLRKHAMIALTLLSLFLVYFGITYPNPLPIYAGTDSDVIEIAHEVGLDFYADRLSIALNQYYLEVEQ